MLKDLAPTHLALCLATITPDGLDDLLKCFNLVNNGRGQAGDYFSQPALSIAMMTAGPAHTLAFLLFVGQRCHF